MRNRSPLLVLVVALALLEQTAVAQDAPDPGERSFEAGVSLAQSRQFDRALQEFEASRRHRETAKVVYNIGSCLRALERRAESVRAFERVRELGWDDLPARSRANLVRYLDELRPQVSLVHVAVNVPDAVVHIDGRPATAVYAVDPGHEIVIEATREGYRPARTTFVAAATGRADLTLRLERLPIAEPTVREEPPRVVQPAEPARGPARRHEETLAGADFSRRQPASPPPAPTRRSGIGAWPWVVGVGVVLAAGVVVGLAVTANPSPIGGDYRASGPR